MSIVALINRIGGIRHRLSGAGYTSVFPMPCVGFNCQVELLRGDDEIYFEGFASLDGTNAPIEFKLSLPFKTMSTIGAEALLQSKPCGSMPGRFMSVPNGFEFIGTSTDSVCSLHLEFIAPDSFRASGMLQRPGSIVTFAAEPAAQWEQRASAKIVALHARARRSDA